MFKLAIVIRTDLDMGKGKISAQVGHAACTVGYNGRGDKPIDVWYLEGQRKIVLKVKTEQDLLDIKKAAEEAKIMVWPIHDAGRTQVPAGSLTCIAVGPDLEANINKIVGHLKLL